jgi:hypothetical protein
VASDRARLVALRRAGLDRDDIAALLSTDADTIHAVLTGDLESLPSIGGGSAGPPVTITVPTITVSSPVPVFAVDEAPVEAGKLYVVSLHVGHMTPPASGQNPRWVSPYAPTSLALIGGSQSAGDPLNGFATGLGSSDGDLNDQTMTWLCVGNVDGTVRLRFKYDSPGSAMTVTDTSLTVRPV